MSDMKMPPEVLEFFRQTGRIGARKRNALMTPERRSQIARIAANARWAKPKSRTKSVKSNQ
jgi:hypothetical protein